MSQLAILGSEPQFPMPLHVGKPNVIGRQALIDRIHGCLDRKWLTNDGPLVRAFERQVASICGTQYCVATCNGTVALQLAIRALGLTGEVIVPSFTFVATAHAVLWEGLRPVFCDVDPTSHVVDVAAIEKVTTDRTSAVLGVHLWGAMCNTAELQAYCNARNIKLFFDAAHAFACGDRHGVRAGSGGECEILSFHATKFLSCGEGGAIVTNSKELAERLALLRNFGFIGPDNSVSIGMNGKMPELSAAMGLTALESMEEILAANRRNHGAYREEFANCQGIRLYEPAVTQEWNHQYVVALVDNNQSPITRDEIMYVLQADNVLARRYFYPGCHRMAPYRNQSSTTHLPVTEKLSNEVLILPTGNNICVEDIRKIGAIVRDAQQVADKVRVAAENFRPRRFDWQMYEEHLQR